MLKILITTTTTNSYNSKTNNVNIQPEKKLWCFMKSIKNLFNNLAEKPESHKV